MHRAPAHGPATRVRPSPPCRDTASPRVRAATASRHRRRRGCSPQAAASCSAAVPVVYCDRLRSASWTADPWRMPQARAMRAYSAKMPPGVWVWGVGWARGMGTGCGPAACGLPLLAGALLDRRRRTSSPRAPPPTHTTRASPQPLTLSVVISAHGQHQILDQHDVGDGPEDGGEGAVDHVCLGGRAVGEHGAVDVQRGGACRGGGGVGGVSGVGGDMFGGAARHPSPYACMHACGGCARPPAAPSPMSPYTTPSVLKASMNSVQPRAWARCSGCRRVRRQRQLVGSSGASGASGGWVGPRPGPALSQLCQPSAALGWPHHVLECPHAVIRT